MGGSVNRSSDALIKGVRLGLLDHGENAIAVYEEIEQRYGKDDSTALREQVAQALLNKGARLDQQGRDKEVDPLSLANPRLDGVLNQIIQIIAAVNRVRVTPEDVPV